MLKEVVVCCCRKLVSPVNKSDDGTVPVFGSHCLPILLNPKMDGNCQFAAAAHQLHICRQKATEWIASNTAIGINSVSCTCTPSVDECDRCWQKYLQNMKKTGIFGDNLTLVALSTVYDIQWVVFSTDVQRHCLISTSPLGEYDARLPIGLLGHDVTSEHYVSLGQVKDMQAVYASVRGVTWSNGSTSPTPPANPVLLTPSVSSVSGLDELATAQSKLCNEVRNALPPDIAVSVFDEPVQPKLTKFPLSPFGKQNRAFSSTNYDHYPFIEYSVSSDRVFCFACRFFRHPLAMLRTCLCKLDFVNGKKCRPV